MAAQELPEMPAGPLLELHGQRKRFHIPQGLKRLLEECSREVLREQPENIYTFLADFIDDQLMRREFSRLVGKKDGRKSWQWRRWSWDGASLLTKDELLEFLSEFHISLEVAQHLAIIIQAAYRGFMGRKEFHHKQEDRKHRRESLWEDWRHAGNLFVSNRDVEEILAYYGISLFEANAYATKIQAVFRGHFHRKSLAEANPELAEHLNRLGITHMEATQHATKIQSLFRGYKARKQLKENQGKPMTAEERQASLKAGLLGEDEMDFWDEDEEYLGGEGYGGSITSMAQAKTRYKKASLEEKQAKTDDFDASDYEASDDQHAAIVKIQAGFRGMQARKEVKVLKSKLEFEASETEEEEYDDEEEYYDAQNARNTLESEYEDPAHPKPKYDAFFPEGYDGKKEVVNGVEVPPAFTHEHFGDIDPKAVREKFSTVEFKQKMGLMLKELVEAKVEREQENEKQA